MKKTCSNPNGKCDYPELNSKNQCTSNCAYKIKEARKDSLNEIKVGSPTKDSHYKHSIDSTMCFGLYSDEDKESSFLNWYGHIATNFYGKDKNWFILGED